MTATSNTYPEPFSRRLFCVGAIAVLAALGNVGSMPVQAAPLQAAPRNIKAHDFLDTFGANVHFNENGYLNTQAIADALKLIGVSRLRSSCVNPAEVAAWRDVAAKSARYFPQGLKANVLVNSYLNAPGVSLDSQKALITQITPLIESIEGPNEINNYYVGNGTHGPNDFTDQTKNFGPNSAAWAQAIYDWRQSTPSLSGARLLAPSIASGDPNDYAQLPDISRYVDAGNFHFYAGNGRQPSNFGGGNFSAIHDWYRAAATPTKRAAVTEWGQTTASLPGQGGCNEATQAKYVLNQMFDAVSKNVYRAYLYQLMDGTANSDPTGKEGTESHFGIFDYQWRPKPAARALANVNALLADATTNFSPPVLAYSVSGITNAGAAGSTLSVSKSNGSTFLAVWNEPQLWDSKANAPVTPPPNLVAVNFGGDFTFRVYDPLVSAKPVTTGFGSSVRVNVLGSPLLIQLVPPVVAGKQKGKGQLGA